MREGLVAEYSFAGNADDSSGAGRHGVVHGASLTTDRFGRRDRAYHFDGLDDYIEVTPPPVFQSDGLTVSAWVRYAPHDFRGWTNCIVAQDDGDDEDQARRVFQLSTFAGHTVWHRMVGARDPMCRRRVRPGVWQHILAVHDRGINRLYVDGMLHDSVEHCLWAHATQPMHIGRKGTAEKCFYFHGAISDVRLYDRALSEAEVTRLVGEDGWNVPMPEPPQPSRDPLSGRWGRDGVVFLDLRYDGGHRVTGQIMAGEPRNMAPIASGTFEPTTGALRLEGTATDPRNGKLGTYLIDGMLDGDELAVVATFDGFSGNAMLTRAGSHLRLSRRSIRSQVGAALFRLRPWFGGLR